MAQGQVQSRSEDAAGVLRLYGEQEHSFWRLACCLQHFGPARALSASNAMRESRGHFSQFNKEDRAIREQSL
jgi:hypothetical protein